MPRIHRIGVDCKLLIRTAGTWGAPTWTEVKTIGDCQLTPTWEKSELKLRLTRVKLDVKTLAAIGVSGKILCDDSVTFETLDTAANSDTNVDCLVLNGPISQVKSRGFRFHAQVHKWDDSQNPGDVGMRDFEISPTLPEVLTELPQRAYVAVADTVTLSPYAPAA